MILRLYEEVTMDNMRKRKGKQVPVEAGSNDGEELVESDYEQEVEDITPETCLDPTNFWDILQVQDVLPAECGSRSDYVDGSEDLSSFDGYDGEEDEGVQPRKFIKTRTVEGKPKLELYQNYRNVLATKDRHQCRCVYMEYCAELGSVIMKCYEEAGGENPVFERLYICLSAL
ncbi:hypothetical protein QYF36_012406 [Acer negundo]|nr:hypothetical protein QYF36_012406 [Acer negundo]